MLDRGYTTTEEIWNGKPGKDSLCHAWSAHPIIHFSNILLGVWQEGPGWKRVRFRPTLLRLSSVRGKVAVPQGIIEAGQVLDQNGKVILVHAEGLAVNSGTIQANGTPGHDAGTVLLHSTQATVLTPTSNLEARGIGENSNGGLIETSTYRN